FACPRPSGNHQSRSCTSQAVLGFEPYCFPLVSVELAINRKSFCLLELINLGRRNKSSFVKTGSCPLWTKDRFDPKRRNQAGSSLLRPPKPFARVRQRWVA